MKLKRFLAMAGFSAVLSTAAVMSVMSTGGSSVEAATRVVGCTGSTSMHDHSGRFYKTKTGYVSGTWKERFSGANCYEGDTSSQWGSSAPCTWGTCIPDRSDVYLYKRDSNGSLYAVGPYRLAQLGDLTGRSGCWASNCGLTTMFNPAG